MLILSFCNVVNLANLRYNLREPELYSALFSALYIDPQCDTQSHARFHLLNIARNVRVYSGVQYSPIHFAEFLSKTNSERKNRRIHY